MLQLFTTLFLFNRWNKVHGTDIAAPLYLCMRTNKGCSLGPHCCPNALILEPKRTINVYTYSFAMFTKEILLAIKRTSGNEKWSRSSKINAKAMKGGSLPSDANEDYVFEKYVNDCFRIWIWNSIWLVPVSVNSPSYTYLIVGFFISLLFLSTLCMRNYFPVSFVSFTTRPKCVSCFRVIQTKGKIK